MTEVIELDMRGRQPPEPLLEALDCIDNASPGDIIRLRTDREPLMLYPHLLQLAIPYTMESFGCPDWVTRIGPLPGRGAFGSVPGK